MTSEICRPAANEATTGDGIGIDVLVKQQIVIPFEEFPRLLNEHLRRNPDSPGLEHQGSELRAKGEAADIEDFIKKVCKWGGYAGVAYLVLQRNRRKYIDAAFSDVICRLSLPTPDIEGAISRMSGLKNLGISFASKHLRFLAPSLCPVLDSILSLHLFYDLSAEGYAQFAGKCTAYAETLNAAGIANPFPSRTGCWYPCDVEAALFAYVNGWQTE